MISKDIKNISIKLVKDHTRNIELKLSIIAESAIKNGTLTSGSTYKDFYKEIADILGDFAIALFDEYKEITGKGINNINLIELYNKYFKEFKNKCLEFLEKYKKIPNFIILKANFNDLCAKISNAYNSKLNILMFDATNLEKKDILDFFISHSSKDAEFVKVFSNWLEKQFNINVFCSSRPEDIDSGEDWLRKISRKCRESDYCLSILSYDSIESNWIDFEAGLFLGNEIERKVIPILIGELPLELIPPTMQNIQCFSMHTEDVEKRFNSLIEKTILKNNVEKNRNFYKEFISEIENNKKAERIMKYGAIGAENFNNNITTTKIKLTETILNNQKESKVVENIPRSCSNDEGEIRAIRIKFFPLRSTLGIWKLGITLRKNNKENKFDAMTNKGIFQFHAGCHDNFKTWTLYHSKKDDSEHFCPAINVASNLIIDKMIELQLWFFDNCREVVCVGFDTNKNRHFITNEINKYWRILQDNWDIIDVSVWGDGNIFNIEIKDIEIDREAKS